MNEVIICIGPPVCLLQDDDAVKAQIEGCPHCRRILIGPDGSECEYKMRPN